MLFNATTFPLNNNTSGAEHTYIYIVTDLNNIQCLIDELTCMRVCDHDSLKQCESCKTAGKLTALPYIPPWGCEACSLPTISPY